MKQNALLTGRAFRLMAASAFLACAPSFVMAQADPQQNAPSGTGAGQETRDDAGWRKLGQAGGAQTRNQAGAVDAKPLPGEPGLADDDADPFQGGPQGGRRQGPPPPPRQAGQQAPPQGPPPQLPAVLTVPRGTYFTIRTTQVLSSDRNHTGDEFTATLVKPIVVDGFIVADRGQTVAGHIVEAQKAGMIKGQSKLAIGLDELTLIDGRQVTVRSQLTGFSGGTSIGRDATAIGTTTALGAIIGAAADGGRGAGIGAGAGAGAGLIGVLLTRGNQTVVLPESVLTFRVEEPIVVSTDRAPQAFRTVGPGDYDQPQDRPRLQTRQTTGRPPYYGGPGWYGPGYGPGWYGPGWGGYYGRGWYGPSVGVVIRPGYGGHYGGRGRR